MDKGSDAVILQHAHVIDPAQGIERLPMSTSPAEKFRPSGHENDRAGSETVDLTGHYLTPDGSIFMFMPMARSASPIRTALGSIRA